MLFVLAGILLSAALPPSRMSWLAWAAPILLAVSLPRAGGPLEWAGAGWLFGIGYFGGALAWLVTLVKYSFFAPLGYVSLAAYAALYPTVACLLLHRLRGSSLLPVLFPAAFAAAELARIKLLWGFPWAGYGWTQAFVPTAAAAARLGGEFAVDFVLFAPAGVALALGRRRLLPAAVVTAALAAVLVAFGARAESPGGGGRMRFLLVQGNIPIDAKWDYEGGSEALERYRVLSLVGAAEAKGEGRKPDLIVWPETAVGGEVDPASPGWDVAEAVAVETGSSVLVGGFTRGQRLFRNSALLIGGDGELIGQYSKRRLVPLGEHLPGSGWLPPALARLIFGRNWENEWLEPGDSGAPLPVQLGSGGQGRLGVLVCYESAMSDLARLYRRDGADCLVTVTNDAWSAWPDMMWQHAAGSALRSMEVGLPLLFCANTGVTMLASPDGGVVALERDGRSDGIAGVLGGEVSLGGGTPYAGVGDLFAWGCIALIAAALGAPLARGARRR